jgi:hypothetical protein
MCVGSGASASTVSGSVDTARTCTQAQHQHTHVHEWAFNCNTRTHAIPLISSSPSSLSFDSRCRLRRLTLLRAAHYINRHTITHIPHTAQQHNHYTHLAAAALDRVLMTGAGSGGAAVDANAIVSRCMYCCRAPLCSTHTTLLTHCVQITHIEPAQPVACARCAHRSRVSLPRRQAQTALLSLRVLPRAWVPTAPHRS